MYKKTNAMRILDAAKIKYEKYYYSAENAISGVEVAKMLDISTDKIFKTLVTQSNASEHFVFMIPVDRNLDLKKAAKAVKVKKLEMLKLSLLLDITGYVHGGCSPIGMKKNFNTTIDMSAEKLDSIVFSAGKIGYQVNVSLHDLKKLIGFTLSDITIE